MESYLKKSSLVLSSVLILTLSIIGCRVKKEDNPSPIQKPTVTTTVISGNTATSVNSGGDVTSNGGSDITAEGVIWSTSPNPTIALSTKTNDGVSSGAYASIVTGLIPGTTYYLVAYATNSAGTGYGNQVTFTTSAPSTLSSGLVAYYPFSNSASDSSGNGNNGNLFGASFGLDRFSKPLGAIVCNTPNSYVKTTKVIQNVINTFTISLWVSPNSSDQVKTEGVSGLEGYGSQSVIHPTHGGNWGDQSQNAGVGIFVGTNQIEIVEHTYLFESNPLVYNTNLTGWHHIVLVYNSHIPSLYLDGILVRTGLKSSITNIRPSNGFDSIYPSSGFGSSFSPNGTPTAQFNGSFDDIRIYNRSLTADEIKYLATH